MTDIDGQFADRIADSDGRLGAASSNPAFSAKTGVSKSRGDRRAAGQSHAGKGDQVARKRCRCLMTPLADDPAVRQCLSSDHSSSMLVLSSTAAKRTWLSVDCTASPNAEPITGSIWNQDTKWPFLVNST